MSLPISNLQDLVLGLATDNAFGSEFLSDPTAVLSGAGLTDITGADVQDIAPLVLDSLPAPVADVIESALGNLPTDAFGANDITGAVSQLQTVAGAVQSLPSELQSTDFGIDGSGDGLTGQLSSAVGAVEGTLGVSTDGLNTGLTAGDTPLGGVTSALAATTNQVAAGIESPLGTYGVATDGLSLPGFDSVSDLSGSLDSDALQQPATVGDTLSSYVSSAGSLVSGAVNDNVATLGDHVSGLTGTDSSMVASGGNELASHVNDVTDTVSGAVSHVPAVAVPDVLPHDLPVTAVAQLPQSLPVPDVAPQVTHAVSDVASHNPLAGATGGSLPDVSHLDAGSATDTLHNGVNSVHDTVNNAVSQSPLGDALHGSLPDVGHLLPTDALHGDLPLGPLG